MTQSYIHGMPDEDPYHTVLSMFGASDSIQVAD